MKKTQIIPPAVLEKLVPSVFLHHNLPTFALIFTIRLLVSTANLLSAVPCINLPCTVRVSIYTVFQFLVRRYSNIDSFDPRSWSLHAAPAALSTFSIFMGYIHLISELTGFGWVNEAKAKTRITTYDDFGWSMRNPRTPIYIYSWADDGNATMEEILFGPVCVGTFAPSGSHWISLEKKIQDFEIFLYRDNNMRTSR